MRSTNLLHISRLKLRQSKLTINDICLILLIAIAWFEGIHQVALEFKMDFSSFSGFKAKEHSTVQYECLAFYKFSKTIK